MHKKYTAAFAVASFFGLFLVDCSEAKEIEGAWELVGYHLEGELIPVSGVVLFDGGHFAMIYTMAIDGEPRFGRAHAGVYAVEQDQVTFDVRQWIQKADGSAGKMLGQVVQVEMDWQEEFLHLRFDGGSMQKLRPMERRSGVLDAGSRSWDGDAAGDNRSHGTLVAHSNRYVMLYVDGDAGAAYGGSASTDGKLDVAWTITVDGSKGRVRSGDGLPMLLFSKQENTVEVQDAVGTRFEFKGRQD